MHDSSSRGRRRRRTARRIAPFAAAALAAAAPAAPAGAQVPASPIAVDAAQDSVVVTGLPPARTTLQVARPDADTGAPVVIGQFQGFAFPGRPVSVNTTAPTPADPAGDCWQEGGLTQSLTPDILPGDTVSVVGGPSLEVPAGASAGDGAPGGPIAGCASLSRWGHNVVSDALLSPNGDLTVSGTAQPLATGVAVAASDGTTATQPVDATLAADGSWSATIPAAQVGALAGGTLSVNGVYAVPDVATGAAAHIAGAPFSLRNATPASPVAAAPAAVKLGGLMTTTRISLSAARKGGITASFVVPTGARLVRIRLARPGRTALLMIVNAGTPGTRQTVRLEGAGVKRLVRGRYAIIVGAGATRTELGKPVLRGSLVIQ